MGNDGLPQYTQFSYAFASFSRFDKRYCYVTIRKIHFLPKLLPVQNVVFYHPFEEELPIRQGIRFRSCTQHPSRRWLWCMCSPWRSCACSRHFCYPLQVTLCPRSVFQLCSPKFQTHTYAFASFSRFGKHYCYVAIDEIHFLPKLLPVQNVVFNHPFEEELSIRQGIRFHSYAQRPSRRWLWCMCSP